MYFQIIILALSILLMIWSTAIKKMNAFFALLIVSILFGMFCGIDQIQIITVLKSGFGKTMEKIGLLIIFGTTLGVILEKAGATVSMANAILRLVRQNNAPMAIALTGFVVGLPIFCDSAFIILSGLNNSLIQKSQKGKVMMASILAFSLLTVHCLVPPHPGITAASVTMNIDLGIVMIWGIILSIPVILFGYIWAKYTGDSSLGNDLSDQSVNDNGIQVPPSLSSFIPVIFPIILIASRSLLLLPMMKNMVNPGLLKIFEVAGDPIYALGIGIALALILFRNKLFSKVDDWASDALIKAGMILMVTAGGGIFGEMIQQSGVGKELGTWMSNHSSGIFLPFILAAILKSAQGSSTVAVITTASIISPMLSAMGIQSNTEILLYVLSMGAGSMVFSHANDSYFWVICKFSNIEPNEALKVYSSGTAIMGFFAQMIIWVVFTMIH